MATAEVLSPTAGSPTAGPIASGARSVKKQNYFAKINELVKNHPQILLVDADNVGSKQMAEVRYALRGKGVLLMGKNTMIRTCLRSKLQEMPQLATLIELVKANIGLLFCESDPSEVRKVLLEHRVPAPAKQGSIAPCDVTVPAGLTGMDPGQTSFFQALGIATKIVKSQIEIQRDVQLIKEGDKVSASQAVLLTKLNIRPFSYGLKPTVVYDDGSSYPASVLDISTEDITSALKKAISSVAAVSLSCSFPTTASVPHSIVAAFKEACGVAFACEYNFPEMEGLKAALENPGLLAAAAAAAPAAAAAATEEKAAPEPEEESDDDMGLDLFG